MSGTEDPDRRGTLALAYDMVERILVLEEQFGPDPSPEDPKYREYLELQGKIPMVSAGELMAYHQLFISRGKSLPSRKAGLLNALSCMCSPDAYGELQVVVDQAFS